MNRITDEQRQGILEMREAGATIGDIAAFHGVSLYSVSTIINAAKFDKWRGRKPPKVIEIHDSSEAGWTLIEMMTVIAIIGILAAIAIPNYIAFRNKTFCAACERDAETVIAAIHDYYSIPTNLSVSKASLELDANGKVYVRPTLSHGNTWNLVSLMNTLEVQVTDASGRCPVDYQASMNAAVSPNAYWDGAGEYYARVIR